MLFPCDLIASQPGAATITVSAEVVHTMAEGLGTNWFSGWREGTYPDPQDDERWDRLFAHLEWLNVRFIRFGQPAARLCDDAGRFQPHDEYTFSQLRRLDAWAQRRGVTLQVDLWSVPKQFQFDPWPNTPTPWNKGGRPSLGVRDIDRYVNGLVVPYLRHVVQEMDCRSVSWFNHTNEPLTGNKGLCPEGIDDHVRYVEVLAAIQQAVREANLSGIRTMGPDTHSHQYWPIPRMIEAGFDPDPHIDAYCMHQYHSRFDWAPPTTNVPSDPMSVSIESQLREYSRHAHARSKPYFVTEIGMFYYGWGRGDPRGISRHDTSVLEAEFTIRAMNEGCDGLLRWTLLNPGDFDGQWQVLHTADGSDRIEPHAYFGAATLMRYVGRRPGILKTVVSMTDSDSPRTIHATAVANGDGSRSLLVVNDSYCDAIAVAFDLCGFDGQLVRITNDSMRKHHVDNAIDENCRGCFTDVLPPLSLTVYTTAVKEAHAPHPE